MAGVKGQVADINSKLDILVSAAYQQPAPRHSTPPGRRIRETSPGPYMGPGGSHNDRRIPSPRRLRSEQNYDGYVDHVTRQDYFDPPPPKGKQTDNEYVYRKPYMYISREDCQTEKQRLDVRCELSVLEYSNAMLKLILDPRAYHPEDQSHIIRHLRDVTHDAMERSWPAVRRWSQAVFDAIEQGDLFWADRQEVQNYRVRIALTAPHQPPAKQNAHGNGEKEYLCREYNSRSGCKHRNDHMDGSVKALHLCAFCDAVNRQCTHSVFSCDRKLMYASNRPQRQQIPNQWRPQMEQPQMQQPAFPKNGFPAPRPY